MRREVRDRELEECNRCSHYAGYRLESAKTPKGYSIVIYCEIEECIPDVKPIPCGYCHRTNVLEEIEKSNLDLELKEDLKKMDMCPNCHEDWRGECLCLLCSCDYPHTSRIKGKKGNYCFCLGCEWTERCPERRKMMSDCSDMKEIPKSKVEEIMDII